MSSADAVERFREAHRKALQQDFFARLRGRPNDLLPFEALAGLLQTYQKIEHRAPEVIPLDKIVGSVGRYKDFTRDFLPRTFGLSERWARIEEHMNSAEGLPPIELFKVGDVYFVADGNHRVSVARANGFRDIQAYVTEYPVDAGLEPGDSLDEAIIKAGRARFLTLTRLDEHVAEAEIYFTRPGGYTRLMQHVAIHQRLMGEREGRDVPFDEAALDWYYCSYSPIVTAIRERQLLKRFPGRTAADLYIWIWNTVVDLQRLFGEEISAEEGAALLELKAPSGFRQAVRDLMRRLFGLARVFGDTRGEMPEWAPQQLERGDGTITWTDEGDKSG